MARRSLLLLALLVPTLAACTLPGTPAARTADCEEGFTKGLLDVPGNPDVDSTEFEDRIHDVCEGLVEAGLDDDSSDAEFLAVLRNNPDLTGEICEISTEVLFANGFDAVVQSFGGYVTREDAARLGRDGCTYAVLEGYGSFTGPIDMAALHRAHPNLLTPFCRAPLMQAYDKARPPQPRRVYEEVVTEVCMEAIRTGVVDYSSGNFASPTIDQRRFGRLLDDEWAKRS
jgi:hypothetical protein